MNHLPPFIQRRTFAPLLLVGLLAWLMASPTIAQPPPQLEPPATPAVDQPTPDWITDAIEDVFDRVWTPRSRFTDSPHIRQAFRPVVAEVRRATVQVRSKDSRGKGPRSKGPSPRKGKRLAYGSIVGPDGWILTKASLLHGPLTVRLPNGQQYDAHLVGIDREFDLAMLKIDATGLATLDLSGHSQSDLLVSTKKIAEAEEEAVEEENTEETSDEKPITDPSLRAGDWVVTPGHGRDPVAIGVLSVAPRKIERRRGILGIRMDLDDESRKGVKIVEVFDGTGAAEAGIQVGDLLVAIDETSVTSTTEVRDVMKVYNPGDEITVTVLRKEKRLRLNAVLTGQDINSRSRAKYQNNLGSKLSKRRFGFPMALQHDTVLKPSDCGGPLVDLDGQVIGFNIARSGRTESYALPTDVVKERLYDLMSGSLAPKPLPKEEKEARQD